MRNAVTTAVVTVGLVAVGGAWHHFHAANMPPRLMLVPVTRGDVIQTVSCTGIVAAPTTVDVGSQVSGTIRSLNADFNSIVHKGDVLARLDPTEIQTEVAAARANLAKATADAEVARVAVDDARTQDTRTHALAARDKDLVMQSDIDAADVTLKEAEAQLRSAEATAAAVKGTLDQAQVDLEHTVITSPVDGIVLARKVDVGQTVAAGFETPSLFSVAADFNKVELMVDVDESEIGSVKGGEVARFRVDAYPDREFTGTVSQVRLRPTVELLTVSYTVVILADNPQLMLRPGMTATISVEAGRHDNVLRVPTQALRFQPTLDLLGALGEQALRKAVTRVPLFIGAGQQVEVWVGRQGHVEPKTITAGLSDGRFTEVARGLTEGTLVTLTASLAQNGR